MWSSPMVWVWLNFSLNLMWKYTCSKILTLIPMGPWVWEHAINSHNWIKLTYKTKKTKEVDGQDWNSHKSNQWACIYLAWCGVLRHSNRKDEPMWSSPMVWVWLNFSLNLVWKYTCSKILTLIPMGPWVWGLVPSGNVLSSNSHNCIKLSLYKIKWSGWSELEFTQT